MAPNSVCGAILQFPRAPDGKNGKPAWVSLSAQAGADKP